MVDDLLLLKPGGRPIYFGAMGDNASYVVEYFETIQGVPTLPAGSNPAQWMMDVSGVQREVSLDADLYDVYKNSELHRYGDFVPFWSLFCPFCPFWSHFFVS